MSVCVCVMVKTIGIPSSNLLKSLYRTHFEILTSLIVYDVRVHTTSYKRASISGQNYKLKLTERPAFNATQIYSFVGKIDFHFFNIGRKYQPYHLHNSSDFV